MNCQESTCAKYAIWAALVVPSCWRESSLLPGRYLSALGVVEGVCVS